MTVNLQTGLPFPRGARRSPPHILAAAMPHTIVRAVPAQFVGLAAQLDYWGNNQYGDCVSAEEAHAKAAWSQGYCGLSELFVPSQTIIDWAQKHGYLNGADLSSVMDDMAKDGIDVNGTNYKDGGNQAVDYSNEAVLQSAIFQGPVKIAMAANALPSGAGNNTGWYAVEAVNDHNTDHCTGLAGFGRADFLYQAMKVPLPSALSPSQLGYIFYTWSTYGFVSHDWLMGCTDEAWVRNPTTPGQSPIPPTPPVPPTPPGPTPGPAIMSLDFSAHGYKAGEAVPGFTATVDIPPKKYNLVPVS